MKAIISIEETDEGYGFTVAQDGRIALNGVAASFGQAWEFCSVWADGETE